MDTIRIHSASERTRFQNLFSHNSVHKKKMLTKKKTQHIQLTASLWETKEKGGQGKQKQGKNSLLQV